MFVPTLVSEREADGSWEDCTWASGVAFANGVAGADVHPPTRAEYEGLRFDATGVGEASGDGSNLRELQVGLDTRYALTDVQRGRGWPGFLQACPPGRYAVLQGMVAGFPPRLQVTAFRGAHAVAIARDRDLSAVLLDPLQPRGSDGDRATLNELRSFYETLPGAEWLVGPMTTKARPAMRFRILYATTGRVTVRGDGHKLVTLDGRRVDVGDGQIREAIAKVELIPALDDAPGDRSTAWLVGRCLWPVHEATNVEAAVLLASAAIPDVTRLEVAPL